MLRLCTSVLPRAAVAAALLVAGTAAGEADEIAYLAREGLYWQVWVMSASGADARQVSHSLYEKAHVDWFPGGRALLVSSLDGKVVRLDLESGEEAPVALPATGVLDAVVSPRGTLIAFSLNTAETSDDNEIWVSRPNGEGARRLTHMDWLQHQPAWGPRGKVLYFLSGTGGEEHDIWRLRLDDGEPERLTAGSLYHFDLDVGPGGRLAFSSNRTGDYELWTWDPDTEPGPTLLASRKGLEGAPSWSPDGQSIAYHANVNGTLEIWTINADGTSSRRLSPSGPPARRPRWLRAGPGDTP